MITRTKPRRTGIVDLTFALPLDAPQGPVSVVGDFNDWEPGVDELTPTADGVNRFATISVPTGTTVRFRYLATGGAWFDDPDADSYDDHGGLLSV